MKKRETMNEKRTGARWSTQLWTAIMLWMVMGLVLLGGTGMTVHAANPFFIEANVLASGSETYDIQVNIENLGADWEGTARLKVDEEYRSSAAYDTMISLPQGSKKQFVVKVPVDSMEDTDGTVMVTLLDKKGNKAAEAEFKRLLTGEGDYLFLGILSDEYSALTYLDMGGEELYFYGDDYPIKIEEIQQGSLVDVLDSLDILVIDTYNTEILTEDELNALELWNYDGGVLLIGTGAYAEDTLKGFEDRYLEISCGQVHAAGEADFYMHSDYMNWSLLSLAELRDEYNQYNQQYFSGVMTRSVGDGAVAVVPYALTELVTMDDSFYDGFDQESFVMNLLDESCNDASARYSGYLGYSYSNNAYALRNLLGMIGNSNNPMQFGILKVIVVLYVIFVGPVLYLILRVMKKRELYWVAVPLTALMGIMLIFFAGRGFEVVDTRVYSVTTQNLSNKGESKTFLYCYDASHEEWDLKLADGFDYVGAYQNDNYNYDYGDDNYYYHMKQEGEERYFGANPNGNFEDCYFYAGKEVGNAENIGSIVSQGVFWDLSGIQGTVTNNTGYDFRYYAVVVNDTLCVYEGLKAGETHNLAEQKVLNRSYQGYDIWSDYVYNFLDDYYDGRGSKKAAVLSALGVGLCAACPEENMSSTVVIGVTDNWEKAVDDRCSEVSYGCLYTVQ